MIIVHFFTRVIKGTTYLMADSSACGSHSPLFDAPEILFEVNPTTDKKKWITRAEKSITSRFNNLVPGDVCLPHQGNKRPQCFDIPFFDKEDVETSD